MTAAIHNGRTNRKTLSSQIDRLDATLDGLAENLNEAVAMAVKEAVGQVVREAVEAAIKEVLANPDLLRVALAQHVPPAKEPETPEQPKRKSVKEVLKNCWSWLCKKTVEKTIQVKNSLCRTWSCCMEKLQAGCTQAVEGLKSIKDRIVNLGRKVAKITGYLGRFWRTLVIALSVGTVIGISCYFAGPVVSSAVSGVTGFLGSLAASGVSKLRRLIQIIAVSES